MSVLGHRILHAHALLLCAACDCDCLNNLNFYRCWDLDLCGVQKPIVNDITGVRSSIVTI